MPSDWCWVRNSCRNPIFCDDGKCFVAFCCRHFLHFVCDLTVSRPCLRHHSTQNSIRNAVMPLDCHRLWNSCCNPIFSDDGKCFCCFYCGHFLLFVYDLTVSQAWLTVRHQSTRISIRNMVVLSDWRRVAGSCRNPFFSFDKGKCLFPFYRSHFLQFVHDLTVSQAWLKHHLARISMRITVIPLDWRRVGDLCRNPFFVTMVSVCFCSVAVTFYISYVI